MRDRVERLLGVHEAHMVADAGVPYATVFLGS